MGITFHRTTILLTYKVADEPANMHSELKTTTNVSHER